MTRPAAWENRVSQRVTLTCEKDHRLVTWTVTSEGRTWEQHKHKGNPTTGRSASGVYLLVCPTCRAAGPHAAMPFPEGAALKHLVEVMRETSSARVTVIATTNHVRAKARELIQRGSLLNIERRVFSTDLKTW